MIFTVQDREEDKLKYIATVTSRLAAEDLVKMLHEQDAADGCLDPDRYLIKKRGLCYSETSKTCGMCTNCVCMADDWETQCPAKIKVKG